MQEVAPALPEVPQAAGAAARHKLLVGALQQFISATHRDWYQATGQDITRGLANTLLAQQPRAQGGLLSVNFDPALLAFSHEVIEKSASTIHNAYNGMQYALQA